MSYSRLGAIALAGLACLPPFGTLDAQRGPSRQGRLEVVEQTLLLKQRLALTDEQVTQLENLRQETVAHRKQALGTALELQSEMRAGRITGQELRARRDAQRESARTRIETLRERFEGILTDDQRDELRSEVRRTRRAGRQGARRGHAGGFRGRDFDGPRFRDPPGRRQGRGGEAPDAPPDGEGP